MLEISYPIERGVIKSWEDMEKILLHTIYSELREDPEDYRLLITDGSYYSKVNRANFAEILFETVKIGSLYIANPAELSLYSSGRTCGVVIESGEGSTSITPIMEKVPLKEHIKNLSIGGLDLTLEMSKLLKECPLSFKSSAPLEIAREIKEKLCFVSQNF